MSKYVLIYPGAPVIELPDQQKTITVKIRNVSEIELTALRLSVKSEACKASISPKTIDGLIPGDRKGFKVVLTRVPGKAKQRYPLQMTLRAKGLPYPAGLDLQVDTSKPLGKGWINVGEVKLVRKESSRSAYYLLAGVPLLILAGWGLYRLSHRRRRKDGSG